MAELITPQLFDHLVQLAALELTPEESVYLREQLNSQLKSIHELEAIPLKNIEEIPLHGIPYPPNIRQEIRPDIWQTDNCSDSILEQVPQIEDRYIIVPEIPHEDL